MEVLGAKQTVHIPLSQSDAFPDVPYWSCITERRFQLASVSTSRAFYDLAHGGTEMQLVSLWDKKVCLDGLRYLVQRVRNHSNGSLRPAQARFCPSSSFRTSCRARLDGWSRNLQHSIPWAEGSLQIEEPQGPV